MELVELFYKTVENVVFYVDADNKEKFYAEYVDGRGRTTFTSVETDKFKGFLYITSLGIDDEGKGLDVQKALKLLKYDFMYHGLPEEVKVHTRVAGDLENVIEYDLQNENLESVVITKKGWDISAKQLRFLASSNSLKQVTPIKCTKNPINLLKPYVNIRGDSLILFTVWLIHCLCSGSHFALMLTAEAGSGKSTVCKIARKIIDPSRLDVMHFPKKVDDLCVILSQAFFVCFDNMTMISKEASDVLCGAVTGTTIAKRELYSNDNLSLLKLHNTILFNGIEVVPEESDLADRIIAIEMKRLTKEQRTTDNDLWDRFEADLPKILGSIFLTLSKAMVEISNVEKCNLERIAEGSANMIAIARALGIDEERFRKILESNRSKVNEQRICNPVVEAVVEYMNRPGAKATESGMCQELFTKIKCNYSGTKSAVGGSASIFSRRLNQEYEALHAHGISFLLKKCANGTELTLTKK